MNIMKCRFSFVHLIVLALSWTFLGPPSRQKQSIFFFYIWKLQQPSPPQSSASKFSIFLHFKTAAIASQQGEGRKEIYPSYPCYSTLSNGAFNMFQGKKKKEKLTIQSCYVGFCVFLFDFSVFSTFYNCHIHFLERRKKKLIQHMFLAASFVQRSINIYYFKKINSQRSICVCFDFPQFMRKKSQFFFNMACFKLFSAPLLLGFFFFFAICALRLVLS